MAWIAALIAAVGGLGGAAMGAYGGSDPKLHDAVGKKDPLYNAALIDALIGMGAPVSAQQLALMSPLAQFGRAGLTPAQQTEVRDLIAQGTAAGLTPDEIAKQLETFGAGKGGKSAFFKGGQFRGAKQGYGSLVDLVKAEQAFTTQYDPAEIARLQGVTSAGRRGAQESVARIQGDFVAPSAADIQAQAGISETALRGQIARERSDAEAGIFEQMNAMGINPAARLGRLDEWQAQQNLEAQPNALARALQLLSGEQSLQTSALGALQGSLSVQSGNAMGMLGLQQSLGAQAANQALALAGMSNQNAQLAGEGIANAGNVGSQAYLVSQLYGQDPAPGDRSFRSGDPAFDAWLRNLMSS
jgi:hypothetical protein